MQAATHGASNFRYAHTACVSQSHHPLLHMHPIRMERRTENTYELRIYGNIYIACSFYVCVMCVCVCLWCVCVHMHAVSALCGFASCELGIAIVLCLLFRSVCTPHRTRVNISEQLRFQNLSIFSVDLRTRHAVHTPYNNDMVLENKLYIGRWNLRFIWI